jgi:hypothetical protein
MLVLSILLRPTVIQWDFALSYTPEVAYRYRIDVSDVKLVC